MGLVSTITRVAKLTPEFLLGTGSEAVGKGIRAAGKGSSIWTKVKAGGKALEKDIAKKAIQGGFFKRTLKSLLSTPKAIISGGKVGARAAKIAGKSATAGAVKGGFKAISKRMPVIGAVLTLAFEAPNIFKAFKDGGVGAGIKEIGGAGVELGAMAAGAAIGSAICPGVGTVIGSIVGGIGGMLLRGKTYSDKKAEEEQAQNQQQPVEYTQEDIQKLQSYGLTPEEIAQIQANGYSMQDVETLLAMEQQQQNIAPQDNTRVEQPYIPQPTQVQQTQQTQQTQQVQEIQPQVQSAFPQFTYQEFGTQPFMANWAGNTFNMNSYSNPYSNDYHYQELFGTGTGFTNPFDFSQQNPYFKFQGNY